MARVARVSDERGNRLDVSDAGIRSYNSAGEFQTEIAFDRDQLGRIIKITGTDGRSVCYEYDFKGDLVAVTDRAGARVEMSYVAGAGAPAHYLDTITDARGVAVLDVAYDFATGRIDGLTDASGNTASISYTLNLGGGRNAEVVTDVFGTVVELVRDSRGNTLREIRHAADGQGGTVYSIAITDYDAQGNRLGGARAFTVSGAELAAAGATRFDYAPADIFWEDRAVYDASGNLRPRLLL